MRASYIGITSAFQADEVGSIPTARSKDNKMDMLDIWNELSWTDGVLFSAWLGIMYYGKAWIDHRFKEKE